VTPERNLDQRMDALRAANEVRSLRAQLKRHLKAGRVSIGPLLLDPPPYLETAKVFDMLLALPKHGRVKATKILQSCQVSPSKTFGGLSERQRAELAERLHRS
jgi:S13-like H2TH domain